jgi:hypothetical protein
MSSGNWLDKTPVTYEAYNLYLVLDASFCTLAENPRPDETYIGFKVVSFFVLAWFPFFCYVFSFPYLL